MQSETRDGFVRSDVFATEAGPVLLTWPDRLTQDEYDDLVAWLEIFKRKAKRIAVDRHARLAIEEPADAD